MKFCTDMYLDISITLLNFKVKCQGHMRVLVLPVCMMLRTHGQYLALSKAWCFCFNCNSNFCQLKYHCCCYVCHECAGCMWTTSTSSNPTDCEGQRSWSCGFLVFSVSIKLLLPADSSSLEQGLTIFFLITVSELLVGPAQLGCWIPGRPVSSIDSHKHLWSTNPRQLQVPRIRMSTYGSRAFAHAGPSTWNKKVVYLFIYLLQLYGTSRCRCTGFSFTLRLTWRTMMRNFLFDVTGCKAARESTRWLHAMTHASNTYATHKVLVSTSSLTFVYFCIFKYIKLYTNWVLNIRGASIIGQFANNRYRPFDNRHRPIIGIGWLFVL